MSIFGDMDIASAADDPFAVEDGTYPTLITKCSVQKSNKGGKGLTFDYTIQEGDDVNEEMVGRKISEWLTIPDENTPEDKVETFKSFIKRRLKALGIPEEEMNSVQPEELINLEPVITVKTTPEKDGKGPFQNITKMVLPDYSETGF